MTHVFLMLIGVGVFFGLNFLLKIATNYAVHKFNAEIYKQRYEMERKFHIDTLILFRQVIDERSKILGIKDDPTVKAIDQWVIMKLDEEDREIL